MSNPSIAAREAARPAPKYITEMTGRQPARIIAVNPDEGGWFVEAEILENRRIPSSADMIALYEIELNLDGTLLRYGRTRRYMRGEALSRRADTKQTPNVDTNDIGPK